MYVAATVLFALVAIDPGRASVQGLDDWWHNTMVSLQHPVITIVARAFDILGGAFITWPLRVSLSLYLGITRRWALLTAWLATIAVSEVAIGTLKTLYDRSRPPDALVETSGASFPSGHATVGAATAVALVIVLFAPGEHRRVWEVRAAIFAFVMALSRTYLRAHWLSDVVAGALLGAATAIAVATVVQVVRIRRHDRAGTRAAVEEPR